MKDVDQLYATFDHCNDLPGVWEDLIRLANGEPVVPRRQGQSAAPPTSEGRAWVTDDVLEEAWSAPLDDWRRFLHPKQAELVTAEFNGPAKVTGSAGTGKTVIGLHRAAYLAGKGEQVFLTTYTSALRHNLDQQLRRLCPPAVAERVRVATLHSFAQEILKDAGRPSKVVDEEVVMAAIDRHTASHPDARLTADFLRNEWKEVIKAQGIETLDEYLVSKRSGLRTGLVRAARAAAWAVFGPVIAEIGPDLLPSYATACKQASTLLENGSMQSPFGAVIADEVQDFGPQEVKFLASLSSHNPARLLLLGDAGQRIYPGGYVLKDLGIDVVGRSRKLNVGYRTGEQIRRFAERVLGGSRDDLDGQLENAANAFALRKGKAPVLKGFASEAEHDNYLTEQVRSLIADGYEAEEIGVIARGRTPLRRVGDALRRAGIPITPVNDSSGGVNLVTMHSAKGLEYRAVLVANCQAGQVPSYAATKGLGQEDRRVVEERERQLLYVSLTRGREELYVLWVNRLSPFLEPAIRVSE
jgi:superfamily I DNA/RNA helicase